MLLFKNLFSHGKSSSLYSKYWQLIENNTIISNQHLTPELGLRLITRDCAIWHQPVQQNCPHPLGEPFWAFYWPGGQALSRYILDNPLTVKGKRVLDFGSGSGAISIAALKSGAKSCVANDIDYLAVAASLLNAKENRVELMVNEENLVGSDCQEYDVILVGDMLYDSVFSEAITAWLLKLSSSKKTILVGDPGRGPIGSDSTLLGNSLCRLAKYELDPITKEDNNGFHQAHVFAFF